VKRGPQWDILRWLVLVLFFLAIGYLDRRRSQ